MTKQEILGIGFANLIKLLETKVRAAETKRNKLFDAMAMATVEGKFDYFYKWHGQDLLGIDNYVNQPKLILEWLDTDDDPCTPDTFVRFFKERAAEQLRAINPKPSNSSSSFHNMADQAEKWNTWALWFDRAGIMSQIAHVEKQLEDAGHE